MVPLVPGTNSAYYLKLLFVPCKYITLQYQELNYELPRREAPVSTARSSCQYILMLGLLLYPLSFDINCHI